MKSTALLSGVLRLRDAGLSTIPIKVDGSKAPALPSWKTYQERLPEEGELRQWFGNGAKPGVALVGGKVSGNLEVIDLESLAPIAEWRELVEEASPGLLDQLLQIQTPTGGLHVAYRCATIAGNTKLAQGADGKTLIETRGEGGYVLTIGSPANCHPSNKTYKLLKGDLKAIPEIAPARREILHDCARAFNERIKPEAEPAPGSGPSSRLRPGDDYNARGDSRADLERHGWRYVRPGLRGELWRRPGKDSGVSATRFPDGSFYVFSSNAGPFEIEREYKPFSIYAILEHGGDFKAAAKALYKLGFGSQDEDESSDQGEEKETDAKKHQTKKAGSQPKQVGEMRFSSTDTGIWATEEDGNKTWVCSPLTIEADTRDEHSENWGRLLKFSDRDGVLHVWAMPMSLLSRDGAEYREYLLNQGLVIASGRKTRTLLESYLSGAKTESKAFCVTKQGWHRGAFVLPDGAIGGNGEPVYLQTASTNHLFRQSGTVEEWRDHVGRLCVRNKRLLLAVSIAFSAPLLEPLQAENGGWHLTGQSSTGKTTALFVSGSVHGGGGDKGYIRRWRATINGLETVAESHHDALLCLDEIAECRPEDVNEAAYMLANGQGKARQSRGGALRRILEWRLVFLSSGEISIADHVAQSGKRVRAGQEVRVINLPADAGAGMGLFEELHNFSNPDEFSRQLQRAARDYYGAPIREFLKRITPDLDALRRRYREFEEELLSEILPAEAASEVSRVAHRFALTAFAGELATEYGITGWEPDDATEAAKTLFHGWLEGRGTSGSVDEETAIRQVRAFIEQHGDSRFQRLFDRVDYSGDQGVQVAERAVANRAGYVRPDEGAIKEFCILPETFQREVCKGFNPEIVITAMKKRDLLRTESGRNQARIRTPEGGQIRVYAIKSEILEE